MAETPSRMVDLGTEAYYFTLPDTVKGREMTLGGLKGEKATVIMFICNHCPYVKLIIDKLVEVAKEYREKGVEFIAISSNDVENYPEDSPHKMHELAKEKGFPFPYLYDETQEVAKQYQAECTPDFFVYDNDLKLEYRGQFDDARPGNGAEVTGEDLKKALDAIIENKPVDPYQKPSVGCNIKWKR